MFPRPKSLANPTVEFVCDIADRGRIAQPVPAKSILPDWFRKLPAVDKAHLHAMNNGLTIKRCMPFLDAMTLGWILPLATTVQLEIKDGGRTVDAAWDFDRVMVSARDGRSLAGRREDQRPTCTLHNYWTVLTPPGWSCLFAAPLNRQCAVIEIIAGVTDTDTFPSPVDIPFVATAPDGVYTLERGTPLVQVIPFRRDATGLASRVRAEYGAETRARETILRSTQAIDGWYRKVARAAR